MLVGERRATILENVRLARPDATDDEIRGAMRLARLEDWVDSLPDGWNTFVGEAGSSVSGGERQRIALARAFLAASRTFSLFPLLGRTPPPWRWKP